MLACAHWLKQEIIFANATSKDFVKLPQQDPA
jgi:hypothetical protein